MQINVPVAPVPMPNDAGLGQSGVQTGLASVAPQNGHAGTSPKSANDIDQQWGNNQDPKIVKESSIANFMPSLSNNWMSDVF